jgi:hypothetical protein
MIHIKDQVHQLFGSRFVAVNKECSNRFRQLISHRTVIIHMHQNDLDHLPRSDC